RRSLGDGELRPRSLEGVQEAADWRDRRTLLDRLGVSCRCAQSVEDADCLGGGETGEPDQRQSSVAASSPLLALTLERIGSETGHACGANAYNPGSFAT